MTERSNAQLLGHDGETGTNKGSNDGEGVKLRAEGVKLRAEVAKVVNLKADTLVFPGGISDGFARLFDDLLEIQTGKEKRMNILHIGGSHVQAGVFTHRMRTRLAMAASPAIGGRGCLFPFRAIRTNAPSSYKMTAYGTWSGARNVKNPEGWALGLAGAAARTNDSTARIAVRLNAFYVPEPDDDTEQDAYADRMVATPNNTPIYYMDTLTVLGEASRAGICPSVVAGGDTICPLETEEKWLSGQLTYTLPCETDSCEILFPGVCDSVSFTLRGIIAGSNRPGVTYTESGVNGAAVPNWLGCEKLTEELRLLRPRLVVFGIGINDASARPFSAEMFKANYRQLIARIREVSPECCFLFITNNDCFLNMRRSGRYINPNTPVAQKAFHELAKETQGAVFDVYEIMGRRGSSNRWVRAKLMRKDHIHFTEEGYTLLGDMLYEAIETEVRKRIKE